MSTDLTAPKKPQLYDILTSKATAEKLRAQMATNVSPDRLARVAWGAIQKTPKLLNATVESVMFCLAECARLGLEPSLGRVYFLPFDNNKKGVTECQIIIGYQGFLDLARRSGIVSSINARCVYENEKFEYKVTIDAPVLDHEPSKTGDKGPLLGAYCIARFKDGGSHVEYMTKSEIEAIRKRSKASNNGPWVTDYDAMALKTVVRRAAKFWPLTTAAPELGDAIQLSDDTEFLDVEYAESPKQSATEKLAAELKAKEAKQQTVDREQMADSGQQTVIDVEFEEPPVMDVNHWIERIEKAKSELDLDILQKQYMPFIESGELNAEAEGRLKSARVERRKQLKNGG